MAGLPQIRLLASNRHSSIDRALRLLGIGSASLVDLALDATERVTPLTLKEDLEKSAGRTVIVGSPSTCISQLGKAGKPNRQASKKPFGSLKRVCQKLTKIQKFSRKSTKPGSPWGEEGVL
jgi:hypothetical protein